MGRSKNTEPETHVVFLRLTFSDAGSTPAASTSLRQGYGWQARLQSHRLDRPERCGRLVPAIAQFVGEGGLSCQDSKISAVSRALEMGRRASIKGRSNAYVYILQSRSHPDQRYVGLTSDLKSRLAKHDGGSVTHTSKFLLGLFGPTLHFQPASKRRCLRNTSNPDQGVLSQTGTFGRSRRPTVRMRTDDTSDRFRSGVSVL